MRLQGSGRWAALGLALGAGCSGVPMGAIGFLTPPPRCEAGAERVVVPPGVADPARQVEGTELRICRSGEGTNVGPHLEVEPSGQVVFEGAWKDGERHGTHRWWTPSGAFVKRVDFEDGQVEGLEHTLAADRSILELELRGGEVVSLRSLPRPTPMPEWRDGERTEGLRHLDAPGSREGGQAEPSIR